MAFEGLTEKLQGALRKLSSKGKLTVLCESVCCHGDDWNGSRIRTLHRANTPRRFQTVHHRHHHIH